MPVVEHRVSVRAAVEHALGGERVIGFRITDLRFHTDEVVRAGMGIEMVGSIQRVLELTCTHLATLFEFPVKKVYQRKRPNLKGHPPKGVIEPGEESRRLMALVVAHGFEAARWRMEGPTCEGIANHLVLQVIPALGATGIELARTERGAKKLWVWAMHQDPISYPPDILRQFRGHVGWFPRRPQPWQQKKKWRGPAKAEGGLRYPR